MKVQRKHGAVETYEVLEESTNYYIIKGSATFVHVVSKADYKPVQEWVDVTHECTLEAGAHGAYCIYRLGYVVNPGNTAHRVTCKGSTFKVEVRK